MHNLYNENKTSCNPSDPMCATINNTNKSDSPCTKNKTLADACYCPSDYYGQFCEKFNEISCNYEKKNVNCPEINQNFYVSAYGGDPPCYEANEETKFE
jgi:hypothetical protein